jgi:hypothetical protein
MARFLFLFRDLVVEGLTLRFELGLMPTSISQFLFKRISKSSNQEIKKERWQSRIVDLLFCWGWGVSGEVTFGNFGFSWFPGG